jgi:hypothetical protein
MATLAAIKFGLAGTASSNAGFGAVPLQQSWVHSAASPWAMGQSAAISLMAIGHAARIVLLIAQASPAKAGCPASNKAAITAANWNARLICCFETKDAACARL